MKKIINSTQNLVDEMIEGMLLAYPYHLKGAPNTKRVVMRADTPVKEKVGIITGGGSGHLPLFLGYTGRGLLDGTAIGDVFSSPSSSSMTSSRLFSTHLLTRLFSSSSYSRAKGA